MQWNPPIKDARGRHNVEARRLTNHSVGNQIYPSPPKPRSRLGSRN
jgi:hypothetical protein